MIVVVIQVVILVRANMRKINVELVYSNTPTGERAYNLKSDKNKWAGVMTLGPTPGKRFCFLRDDGESMCTSTVQNIRYLNSKTLQIMTRNSTYKIKLGEEFND